MRKLGKFQQKIYDDIYENKCVHLPDIYSRHSPFVHSAYAINGYFDNSRVTKVLVKLKEYNLIEVENYGRTDCKVYLKNK